MDAAAATNSAPLYDVVIVGAGPAGLSAALSLAREHFAVLVLEKSAIGGNLLKIAELENYAGFTGSGSELAQIMKTQAKQFGAKLTYGTAMAIDQTADRQLAVTTEDETYRAKAVLLANGQQARELEIAGLQAPLHYCATCDGPLYQGQKVAVIGGGDSAFQTALFLAGFADQVSLVMRAEPRANGVLLQRAEAHPRIVILRQTLPTHELLDQKLQVAAVFAEIGSDPQALPQLADNLATAPNFFAAGDCRPENRRQVVAAVADGAAAAEKIRRYLDLLA